MRNPLLPLLLSLAAVATQAQSPILNPDIETDEILAPLDTLRAHLLPSDELVERFTDYDDPMYSHDSIVVIKPLSPLLVMPAVYTHYQYYDKFDPFAQEYREEPYFRWVDEENARARNEGMLLQRYMINNMPAVRYNIRTLPEAPKRYIAEVNPKDHTIEVHEITLDAPAEIGVNVRKRHWLKQFDASLQFSQAYISPNWYQGGNNNLNMLANVYYNVKLNQKFHPKLLFETTFQYKLGLNNAPDDSLRNYAISEDLLQINTTFGYKAAHRWYYSLTAQFKTQILNSYAKNSHSLHSAFLSPGELNLGVGMTYNIANKKKTFTFDASIAPLSYNMKICSKPDDKISHSTFGIDADKDYVINIGSTAECKLQWQISYNIQFRSRLFMFTDYSYIQADWENTLVMNINRYLTTQIYCHARYDSTTPPSENPHWHKLQVKEILSFGVAYHFSSI